MHNIGFTDIFGTAKFKTCSR